MRSNWLALGAALCGLASGSSCVDPGARIGALAVVLIALAASRRRVFILLALTLGVTAARRVESVPLVRGSEPSDTAVLALELEGPVVEGRAIGWARDGQGNAWRARIRGLDPDLQRGARLLVSGRVGDLRRRPGPDRRDPVRSARARRIQGAVVVLAAHEVFDPGSATALDRLRARWSHGMDRRGRGAAGLWRALVLADRSALADPAFARVQQLGMAHLLALSGMHTSILAGALLLPFRRWGRRAMVLVLPALFAWVVLAGAGPSLVRSTGMVAWWVIARRAGRSSAVEDGLAAVALVELTWRPHLLYGVGWWLSYAATLAVVRCSVRVAHWPRAIGAVLVSVAAQASTLPWALDSFGFVSLLAPFTLLFVAPVFAFALVTGLAALAAGSLFPPVEPWCDLLLGLAAHGFGAALALAGQVGPAAVRHPGFEAQAWSLALLGVAIGLWPARVSLRWRAGGVLGLLLVAHALPAADHEWVLFDVGQGDASLLRCGDRYLVVDSGPRWGVRAPAGWTLVDYLERRRARAVDVAITHGHLDHSGGLAELLATGRTDEVLVAASDSAARWVESIRATGTVVRTIRAGDRLEVGHCEVRVLWPGDGARSMGTNDRSLALQLDLPTGALLLTGDLEAEAESALLGGLRHGPAARWLKVAHHGGNTGTTDAWLERVAPEVAFISCGAGNRYGHPSAATLARLRSRGVRVLRTDELGFIRLRWSTRGPEVILDAGPGRDLDGGGGHFYPAASPAGMRTPGTVPGTAVQR